MYTETVTLHQSNCLLLFFHLLTLYHLLVTSYSLLLTFYQLLITTYHLPTFPPHRPLCEKKLPEKDVAKIHVDKRRPRLHAAGCFFQFITNPTADSDFKTRVRPDPLIDHPESVFHAYLKRTSSVKCGTPLTLDLTHGKTMGCVVIAGVSFFLIWLFISNAKTGVMP